MARAISSAVRALASHARGHWFDPSIAHQLAARRLVGVNNLADFMAHGLGLVGVYLLLRLLDGLVITAGPLTTRWLLPFLVVALAGSAILFFTTPMPTDTSDFTIRYGSTPTIAGYWSISIVFPVLCLVQLSRTIAAHWHSPSVVLRRGLKVAGLGVALGFVYAAVKLFELLALARNVSRAAAAAHSYDRVLLGGGLLLIGAGLAAPWFAATIRRGETELRVRRSLHRLRPLWRVVHRAAGTDVLDKGPADLLLLRRVVEIRDAQALLWSHLREDDVGAVRQRLQKGRVQPTVIELEGHVLALAVRRELSGPCELPGVGVRAKALAEATSAGPINLTREVDDLAALARVVTKALRLG